MGYVNTDVTGKEGELLTIQSPVAAPVTSLKVYFSSKQEGEGTPSPENVRPISGWTGCEVYRTGKNLIDLSVPYQNPSNTALVNTTRRVFTPYTYSYGASYSNWWQPHQVKSCSIEGDKLRVITNDTAYGVGFAVPVKAGWALRLSYHSTGRTHIAYYDRWGKYISGGPTDTVNLTVPNQAAIGLIIFESYPSGAEVVFSDIMLTVQTAVPYEPCHGNTLSVNWKAEIGTVYGGYVDLVRGVVVEEWHSVSINKDTAMRNFSPDKRNQGQGCEASYWLSTFNAPNAKGYIPYSCDGYCDKLQYYENAYNYESAAAAANSTVDIRLAGVRPLEDYLSWLEENGPIQVVYKLATPIEHPIPPVTFSILRGVNCIWTDGDSVDVSYRCAETRDMILTRRQAIMAQPHVSDWITGNPRAVYEGDMLAAMKNCRAYFSPRQEGSGDPSPTNVRPITGWTGIRAGTRTPNILNLLVEQAQSTPISSADTTKRSFVPGSCVIGISPSNYYRANYANYVKAIALTENSLSFTSGGASGYGIGYVLDGVKPGDSVKFSYGEKENLTIYITAYEADGTFIGYQTVDNAARTVPEGASTVLLVMASAKSNELCYVTNPKLELGITATPYEPYRGQTVAVDWTAEAGTVYGGYVDLVRGEVVQEWGVFTVNGSSALYNAGTAAYNGTEATNRYTTIPRFKAASPGQMISADYLCDTLNVVKTNTWSNPNAHIWECTFNAYNQLHMVFDNTALGINSDDDTQTRNEAISAWLADHPITVVYRLAAPVIYRIGRHVVKSLRGLNNVWSDAKSKLDLRYWTHTQSVKWDYEYYPTTEGMILPENNIYVSQGQKVTISWKTTTDVIYTNRYIWRCIGARFDNAASSYVGKLMSLSEKEAIEMYTVTQAGRFIAGNYRVASEAGAEDTAFIGDYIKVKIED